MKSKIICLILALVMCLSCLAGCFGGGDDTNDDDGGKDKLDEKLEPGWWDAIKYSESDLTFQMTNNSQSQELRSGCNRYLAGGTDAKTEDIDTLISERNENARKYTKVNVTYRYYEDLDKYAFATARKEIFNDIMNGQASAPDMYCNFMTDMLICSLQGCFANLNSTSRGDNFIDLTYTMEYDGNANYEPYMSELMGSLTLNTSKFYVMASDYFIDIMRAAYVVPVNAELYNILVTNKHLINDLNGDGVIDIEDFFMEVKPCDCLKCDVDEDGRLINDSCKGNWTYERLGQYAEAIYEENTGTDNVEGEDATDTLGFILGQNGLPAAGLIYTSTVTVIEKTKKTDGTFDYSYPATNQALIDLVTAVEDMMDNEGVYCLTQSEATDKLKEKTALLGVRKQFTTDKLLFGGIILVGSLEYNEYQGMKNDLNGGFGVVPVPVYQKGDAYLTQIHVVGRAGGINNYSTKFSQCSAFLHYQSTHSTEILDEFYNYNLVASTAAGVKGNVEMLQYIRQNVRTSFDKLFEDAVCMMYAGQAIDENDRYHARLANEKFTYEGKISSDYIEFSGTKADNLKKLEISYEGLPE